MPDSVSKERRAEYNRRYREKHPDYWKVWNREHPDKRREYNKAQDGKYTPAVKKAVNAYHARPLCRAQNLLTSYRQFDSTKGWETDITSERIKELITTRTCIYCGCSDWKKLGLDRISNDRPHSIFNVVVSCRDCNVKRGRKPFWEYLEIIGKDPFKDLGFKEADELVITY